VTVPSCKLCCQQPQPREWCITTERSRDAARLCARCRDGLNYLLPSRSKQEYPYLFLRAPTLCSSVSIREALFWTFCPKVGVFADAERRGSCAMTANVA